MNKNFGVIGVILAALLFCLCSFGGVLMSANNTIVRREETVKEQKSVIDAQLQRRHDLILSLVNTIESQAKFEKDTLTAVVEMRRAADSGNVDEALLNMNAVVEQYPTLTTAEGYSDLRNELSVTENLILEQRKTYNGSVKQYRNTSRKFPNSLFLSILGYQASDYEYLEFDTPEYSTTLFTNE